MKKKVAKYRLFNSKLTSIFSISMVLFLLGIIFMIIFIGNGLSVYVRENITLSVILKENAEEKNIFTLEKQLKEAKYVKNVRYISKEEALEETIKEMGHNPLDVVKYNPLPAILEINLKSDYANNDSILFIAKDLDANDVVKQTDYKKNYIHKVDQNIKKLTVIFLFIAGLLLIISFILINNTMRLLIYSNRFLIHTMKLVGATKGFIRKPYIMQGIWIGLAASVFAILYIVGLLYLFRTDPELTIYLDLYNTKLYATIFGFIILSGIIITSIASFFAVNKYLKHNLDDLYYL
jgi:cell division transport system permease protein